MVLSARSPASKDAELLVLRQERWCCGGRTPGPGWLTGGARRPGPIAARTLRTSRLVTPVTLLRFTGGWSAGTGAIRARTERPPVDSPIAAPTGQMTRENPGRGYKPIQRELKPPQSLAGQFT
jgi:hypothetical protein